MTSLQERVNDLIDDHCQTRAEWRAQRFRVSVAEFSGMPEPEVIAEVEASLAKCYALLHDVSKELAAVSAKLEFDDTGEGVDDGR
jgi:hypothetical protein